MRTYWHHPESSCVFIAEDGEDWDGGDGLCVEIDEDTYHRLKVEYETPGNTYQTQDHRRNAIMLPDPNMNPFGTPADSDSFEFDGQNVQSGFRIKAGDYVAKLVDLTKGNSKAGNPMWTATFTITQGDYAGRDFKLFLAQTPAAAWKTAEMLTGLGLAQGGQMAKFTKADAINRRCILKIKDDVWEGNDTSSIDKVLPHPDGPIAPGAVGGNGMPF